MGLNKPPLVFPQNAAVSRPGEYDSAIGCYQEAPVISPGRSWFPKSYIYIYIYIYVCICVCIGVCICVCICICIYVYVYVYTIYPDILLTLE